MLYSLSFSIYVESRAGGAAELRAQLHAHTPSRRRKEQQEASADSLTTGDFRSIDAACTRSVSV